MFQKMTNFHLKRQWMHIIVVCPLGSEASTSTKGLMSDRAPPVTVGNLGRLTFVCCPRRETAGNPEQKREVFMKGVTTVPCAVYFTAVLSEARWSVCTSDVQSAGGTNWTLSCYLHGMHWGFVITGMNLLFFKALFYSIGLRLVQLETALVLNVSHILLYMLLFCHNNGTKYCTRLDFNCQTVVCSYFILFFFTLKTILNCFD